MCSLAYSLIIINIIIIIIINVHDLAVVVDDVHDKATIWTTTLARAH